jgi:hypothetical protein
MTDLSSERSALTTLMQSRQSDSWTALAGDGWLDTLPENDGTWPLAAVAALVASVSSEHQPTLAVGAHLAAAATLTAAGLPVHDDTPHAVLIDTALDGDDLIGSLWGPAGSGTVVLLPDGGLATIDLADADAARTPVMFLAGAGIRRVRVPLSRASSFAPAGDSSALFEARLAFLLAAEAIGAAAAATARTLAYLRVREQFGKPLGAQQALQHRLVDMTMNDLVGAALVDRAAGAWETGDGAAASWSAKAHAGAASVWTTEQAIQLHGAVGFTEELGLAASLRRLQRCRLALGGQERAATRVAADAVTPPGPRDWTLDFDPGH